MSDLLFNRDDTEAVIEIGAGQTLSSIRYMSETHMRHNKK